MRNTFLRYLASTLAVLFLSGVVAMAQVETGQIAGTIMDQSGAVVTGATVTVKNLDTNAERKASTSDTGAFTVVSLTPGKYLVSVKSGDFKPYSARVEVTVGGHVTLDAKLSVSAATTDVQVVAEGGAQVNTQTQELSQMVDSEQVSQLPSLTRNPYDFVAISGNISNGDAGASGSSTGATSNAQNSTTRGVGFNINGQRSSGTEILLDGVENIGVFTDGIGIFIPLDGMQEYRISTSNFEAQFGRASGGVVNVITKAGTNAFHGDAWEYNRLSAYTSNTETNDQEGLAKGTYTRNQFGFAVGGPIIKNKLFVFGSTEWIRVRSAAQLTAVVPTAQFLALSNSNIQNYFNAYGGTHAFEDSNYKFLQTPLTASQVYGANIPAGLPADTPSFGLLGYSAPQNAGGGVGNNTYNILARADYNLNDKTQMFFRYVDYKEVDEPGSIDASPYSQYNVGQTLNNQAYLLNLAHEYTPNLSSNTKLSFSRFNTSLSYDTTLQNVPTLYLWNLDSTSSLPAALRLPGFYDENTATGGLPYGGPQNTAQINQDLNWLKGKHSTQFGTQLIYIQENNAYGAYGQAIEQLGSDASSGLQALYSGDLFEFQKAVDPKGALPCVNDPYTGVLTQTDACSITLPATAPNFARSDRFKDWAVYGQDSWKLTPQFTFNYGVRYEYYGVQHNNNTKLDSNFYYGSGSSLAQTIRDGQVYTVPNSPIHKLWNPQYGTVSPRVGFAYDIFGNGRDSIRGGYGIAYERNFGNVTFNLIQNPPNYAVVVENNTTVSNTIPGPLGGTTGSIALAPTSLRQVDQNIRTAQTQFWSLAVEHEFAPNTVISLQYVGARGVHLYDIKNYNGLGSGNAMLGDPVIDPVVEPGSSPSLTRLNNQYSNINNRGSNGYSFYHGLNLQFQSTDLHHTGLSVVANYTLAHSLDNLSTTFSESNNAFSLGYTNPFNPKMDYGNGDLDVRHRLVIAPIYAEPFFKNHHDLLGEVLGGWQLAGIFVAHTGAPFSYFDYTNNATGYNVARYTPDSKITKHTFKSIPSGVTGGGSNLYPIGVLPGANSWSNPNLLGISDWGPWPSTMTTRNSFRGPGFWNLDMAMSKTFPIRGNLNIEFRAEGFNIFNHHNLYLQEAYNDVSSNNLTDAAGPVLDSQRNVQPLVLASKGGIGNNGGANDERRFGQFALKVNF